YDPLYEPEQLAPWIHQRETNRRLGARKPLPEASLAAITQAMESVPGIRLHISTDEEGLAHWTEMVGEAERLRLLDPQGHRSFFEEELRWNTEHAKATGDGVDLDSLDLRPAERAGLRLAQDPS